MRPPAPRSMSGEQPSPASELTAEDELGRDNTVTTSNVSNPSSESRKFRYVDESDAGGSIYTSRPRLRALWAVRLVEVRVLSGALQKAPLSGVF
jgi:hypothetical protein